jgi:hypothetical protein
LKDEYLPKGKTAADNAAALGNDHEFPVKRCACFGSAGQVAVKLARELFSVSVGTARATGRLLPMDRHKAPSSPEHLAWQLVARCRQDIQAAWEQLDGAWRSLGRLPTMRAAFGRAAKGVSQFETQRQPHMLARTSPLKLKAVRKPPRPGRRNGRSLTSHEVL